MLSDMASFFDLVFIMMLSSALAAQNFVSVSVCPRDQYTWDLESNKKKCQGDTPDYLCAAIENQLGKYGEICTKFGLTPANKCAVLNEQTKNLDSVDCKADSGCPTDPYIPSVLWKYQICYKDFYGTTTSLAPITTPTITSAAASSGNDTVVDGLGDGGSGSGAGVAVAVVIILIIVVVVVVMVVFYVRNQFGFKDKVQQLFPDLGKCFQDRDEASADAENGEAHSPQDPLLKEDELKKKIEKLEELLKYLVHILKQELGVNDLKEKVVIHSKSIKEHFTEPLIKDMLSVRDLDDYSQLDRSLVFALLRNFCGSINASSRGWDYEPPDDETHVGADIERIRSMWNKYCDDDLQFKHLDDVYNRMKQKYGTVAVDRDEGVRKSTSKNEKRTESFEIVKVKIQSIKLNEDCTMEEGIVITENISNALKILESRNVVILKGVIGCGKTHALKAIQNHFKGLECEMTWVEPENIQGEIAKEKPAILLCDNLFGRFGSSVFSQVAVNKIEEALKEIDMSKRKLKVAIGIHTHVYEEVKKNLKLSFLHQRNITVDMDNLSDAETLLIFKEQLKKGHCKTDSNCWFNTIGFQSVLDKLSKNQGQIGGPFLSLMYCNQHEMFSDEAFSVKPVETLVQHFRRMRLSDSHTLYGCLVYLMCVQEHNCEEGLEEWAGLISAYITKDGLENIAKTSAYTEVQSKRKSQSTKIKKSDETKNTVEKTQNKLKSKAESAEKNSATKEIDISDDNQIEAATLTHEILSVALFKSAADNREIFFPVLVHCDVDLITQLMRPASSLQSDLFCEFMDASKNSEFRECAKACVFQLTHKYEREGETNHPLMTIGFVKEKFKNYLIGPPKFVKQIF